MRHPKVGRMLIKYMSSLSDTLILPWCAAIVIVQVPYGSLQQRLMHTPHIQGGMVHDDEFCPVAAP